jgi:hypothetical protein
MDSVDGVTRMPPSLWAACLLDDIYGEGRTTDLDDEALQDFYEMCTVFEECMRIYCERNKKYRNNWKRFGWMASFFHMQNKFSRIEMQWWKETVPLEQRDLDSHLDLIVYTMFMVLLIRAGNERG